MTDTATPHQGVLMTVRQAVLADGSTTPTRRRAISRRPLVVLSFAVAIMSLTAQECSSNTVTLECWSGSKMICQPTSGWLGSGARVIFDLNAYRKAYAANDRAGMRSAVQWPLVTGSAPIYNGAMQQIGTSGPTVSFNFGQYKRVLVGSTLVRYAYVWSSPLSGWIPMSSLSADHQTLLDARAPATNPNLPQDTTLAPTVYTFGGADPSSPEWSGFEIMAEGGGSSIGRATDYLMRPESNYNVNITFGIPNSFGKYKPADGGFAVDTVPSVRSGPDPTRFQLYAAVAPRTITVQRVSGGRKETKEMEFVFGRVVKGTSYDTYGWVARAALTP